MGRGRSGRVEIEVGPPETERDWTPEVTWVSLGLGPGNFHVPNSAFHLSTRSVSPGVGERRCLVDPVQDHSGRCPPSLSRG